jgi:branched-chain amino acid transport system ATP-binding protein
MTVLVVDSLSKEFGGVHAIEDLSFTIDSGHIYSIIGPNGAGKTTLFNLITGVYTPSAGRIFFEGAPVVGLAPHRLAARGMSRTFQNLQIFLNMTALENVQVGMHRNLDRRLDHALFRYGGLGRKEAAARDRAAELMEYVGLASYIGHEAASMPYGALKRLEIARALATEPKLLLLDEPAAGLNAIETGEIDDLIRKIAEGGVTVALVEHDMHLVMGVSDHILVLDYGRKLTEGNAEQVRSDPEVIAAYLGSEAVATGAAERVERAVDEARG